MQQGIVREVRLYPEFVSEVRLIRWPQLRRAAGEQRSVVRAAGGWNAAMEAYLVDPLAGGPSRPEGSPPGGPILCAFY